MLHLMLNGDASVLKIESEDGDWDDGALLYALCCWIRSLWTVKRGIDRSIEG